MSKYENITEAIGNTPLLKLNRIGNDVGANIFVKLEHLNPSGSYKDRMALAMIEAAERGETWNNRKLIKGGTVVEASAGNTAPALALVCASKGYNAIFVLYRYQMEDERNNRKLITQAYGPEIRISSNPEDYLSSESLEVYLREEPDMPHVMAAKMDCARMEEDNPTFVWVDQIYNPYNYIGQIQMAKEIYEQLEGRIDAVGCSVGAGGSLYGLCKGLSELGVKLEYTFGVVPEGSECYITFEGTEAGREDFKVSSVRHDIAKEISLDKWVVEKSIIQQMIDNGYPDLFYHVTDEEARLMANRLCQEEGIFCGMSSGANVVAAMRIAQRLGSGKNIVTTIVDSRDRYLSETPKERYVV